MGEPAWVLAAWLRHATRDGAVLAAGSVVTTGTWCGILQAQAGDAVQADFDGIGQARLQL
jgi:2-keto-4-pentenoate hydratase